MRIPKLLALAHGKSCVDCGNEDGTIVAAHSNLLEHGKGRGIKAHDGMSAWLCFRCHSELDQGKAMSKQEREVYTKTMILRTYMRLWDDQLIGVKG
jgi:hypothetical protein